MAPGRNKAGSLIDTLRYVLVSLTFLMACLSTGAVNTPAQGDQDAAAPPPLQAVSREDLQRLGGRANPKDRTKLSLELLNNHLSSAEQARASENFEAAYRELGAVHALLDNAVNYLIAAGSGDHKPLDEFKRLEIGIRALLPRIESIRRDMPLMYDDYLRALLKHVRDARAKAIEPFFDDSIVKDRP